MSQVIQFQEEFSTPTQQLNTRSNRNPATGSSPVSYVHFEKAIPPTPLELENSEFDDFMASLESNPEHAVGLKEARAWVADAFYEEDGETLKTVRLRKGFTQKQLAELVGTSQPQIAKLERGLADPLRSTCKRLCEALSISPDKLDEILDRQEELNRQKASI